LNQSSNFSFWKKFFKPSTSKILALLYAIIIFIISAIPELNPPELGFKWQDKVYHFLEYSIFSLLLFLAFFTSKKELFNKHAHLFSSLVGILYAGTDEIHQLFVPGREADIIDFIFDSLAVIFLQVVIWFFLKYRKNFPSPK
jgi:VanZ family protein